MADSFKFELVSPESLLVSKEVSEVIIPGTEGEMTVMVDHAPLMTTIRPGIVTVKDMEGKVDRYVVFGGFADVLPTGCTLLAESASHVDDADRDDLQRRIDDARREINESQDAEKTASLEQYLHQLTTLENSFAPA